MTVQWESDLFNHKSCYKLNISITNSEKEKGEGNILIIGRNVETHQHRIVLLRHDAYTVQLCAGQFETSTSPPPRAYPGHLTVHRARGGGNLNVALEESLRGTP